MAPDMASANQRLRDAAIDHQIDLTHVANGMVRKIMSLLNKADAELFARLTVALQTMDPESFTVQRLEGLLLSIRDLNSAAYERVRQAVEYDMRELADIEAEFQGALLDKVPPIRIPTAAVASDHVYAAVMARPFQGRLLREWAMSIGEARMARIRDNIRLGYMQGETVDQMVRRIRGTKAKGYSDGIIEIDRRNAEAVVRTAVSHTAAVAREQIFKANSEVIKAVQWVSTLDSRTTEDCRVRDGLRFTLLEHKPIGHSIPWCTDKGCGPGQAHWNCRSSAVPVLKSWQEMGIDAQDVEPETRSSMDGMVPAGTTYAEWFAAQPAARQDEIVGPTRGRAFREGKVSFDRFYNEKGRWMTLEQLRRRGIRV